MTSILYSLRTAVFRPEDDELEQLVVGVACRVIKPACPPDNGVSAVPLLLQLKMSQSIGPIPIVMEDHSHVLCEQLQQLRNQNGLLDLDIMCEVR